VLFSIQEYNQVELSGIMVHNSLSVEAKSRQAFQVVIRELDDQKSWVNPLNPFDSLITTGEDQKHLPRNGQCLLKKSRGEDVSTWWSKTK